MHQWVQCFNTARSRMRLGFAHTGGGMDNLTVQIRQFHDVVINNADGAHAHSSQVEQHGRAESTGTDYKDFSVAEFALACCTKTRQNELAGIAVQFFWRNAVSRCSSIVRHRNSIRPSGEEDANASRRAGIRPAWYPKRPARTA